MLEAHQLLLDMMQYVREPIIEYRGKCKILVMPREDYKLSFDLYDDGNKDIVNLVPNAALLREMLNKCVRERADQKPPMYWRPHPKQDDIPFSVIIVETFFRNQSNDNERHTYLEQVDGRLHKGGVLFCYLPMESIGSFFRLFCPGWATEIFSVDRGEIGADVLIIVHKCMTNIAFPVRQLVDINPELSPEIDEENKRRKDICGVIENSGDVIHLQYLAEVQEAEGVESIVFRSEFHWIADGSTDFLITLNDIKKPDSKYQAIVLYIPYVQQRSGITKRANHRFFKHLISHSNCRFLVVCPGEGVGEKTVGEIKELLGGLLDVLTPENFKKNNVITILGKKKINSAIKAMEKSSRLDSAIKSMEDASLLEASPSSPTLSSLCQEGSISLYT